MSRSPLRIVLRRDHHGWTVWRLMYFSEVIDKGRERTRDTARIAARGVREKWIDLNKLA